MDNSKINILEDKKIYAVWDDLTQDWYFSIVDVCKILADASDPRRYWSNLNRKLKTGESRLYENIIQLKMQSAYGKFYKTDVATTEQLLSLVQSILNSMDVSKELTDEFKLAGFETTKQYASLSDIITRDKAIETSNEENESSREGDE